MVATSPSWMRRLSITTALLLRLRGIGDALKLFEVVHLGRSLPRGFIPLGIERVIAIVGDALRGIRRNRTGALQLRQFVRCQEAVEHPLPIRQPHGLPP